MKSLKYKNNHGFLNVYLFKSCIFLKNYEWYTSRLMLHKHGGLDSRDQSRSRTSFVLRLTFLNWVEINFFFSRSRFFSQDFDASKFLSRSVEIFEICRGRLSLKMMKSLNGLRNVDMKIQKSTHFLIEIEINC
jgi:hypothetical protein